MQNNIKNEVKEFVNEVVARFNPDKIILFGSQTSEKTTTDSDVDLLVRRPDDIACRLNQGDFFIKK